jgi:hypothetical protein
MLARSITTRLPNAKKFRKVQSPGRNTLAPLRGPQSRTVIHFEPHTVISDQAIEFFAKANEEEITAKKQREEGDELFEVDVTPKSYNRKQPTKKIR